jgi:hypothetical protein
MPRQDPQKLPDSNIPIGWEPKETLPQGRMPREDPMMLPDPNLPIGWEPEEALPEDWMPRQDLMVLPDPNLPTFWEPTETLPEGWMPRQGPMMLPEPNLPTGWDPDESLPEGWKSMSNLRVVSEGDVINDIDDIDGQGSVPSTSMQCSLVNYCNVSIVGVVGHIKLSPITVTASRLLDCHYNVVQ